MPLHRNLLGIALSAALAIGATAAFAASRHAPAKATSRHAPVKAASQPAPAKAASPAANAIKIGFTLPLSGRLTSAGKGALTAFEIWRDEVNARGGLLGRPVEFVRYDDQGDALLARDFYARLLDTDKVDLVVAPFGRESVASVMPLAIERKLLFMAMSGAGANGAINYERYFQTSPAGPDAKHAPSRGFLETAMTMDPKPRTIALAAADGEYAQEVIAGARETASALGLKIVYDKSYPPRIVDFVPLVRAIAATQADVVFVASYPPDTAGILRAVNEVGLKPKMLGGAMGGLGLGPIKAQLGPLLNGVAVADIYAPASTLKFAGAEEFLAKYQERAKGVGVDPLGYHRPPYAYAQMQILEQAVAAVGSLDQSALAAHIHKATFSTIVGEVKFAGDGEWEKPRVLLVQYQGVTGHDLKQFAQGGKQIILYPPELKSGLFFYPFEGVKK
jgi:branched-chain amino acid transport system substrate-binding protein